MALKPATLSIEQMTKMDGLETRSSPAHSALRIVQDLPTNSFDVLVVGAGISGISAARSLSSAGLHVCVLEGRDRIGGRLHTSYALGLDAPVDLGGAWIHGQGSTDYPNGMNEVFKLAKMMNIPMAITDYNDAVILCSNKHCLSSKQAEALNHLFSAFHSFMEQLVQQPGCCSAMSVLDAMQLFVKEQCLSAEQQACLHFLVHTHIEQYWGGEAACTSLGILDEQRFGGPDVVLPQGYGTLVKRLAEGLDVRLNHIVHSITYAANCVTVSTNYGCFTARYAIVTLPLGVLKSGDVTFHPPLEVTDCTKAAAIQRLGATVYDKVVLHFDAPFWDDKVMLYRMNTSPAGTTRSWSCFLNLHKVLNIPALVAFNLGKVAMRLQQQSDAAVKAEALEVLHEMYGAGNVPEPRTVLVTRWSLDPFSRMSYSFIPVGAATADCELLRRPIQGSLYFAGEATSRRFYGTVHGAFDTSRQAVAEILAAVRLDRYTSAPPALVAASSPSKDTAPDAQGEAASRQQVMGQPCIPATCMPFISYAPIIDAMPCMAAAMPWAEAMCAAFPAVAPGLPCLATASASSAPAAACLTLSAQHVQSSCDQATVRARL